MLSSPGVSSPRTELFSPHHGGFYVLGTPAAPACARGRGEVMRRGSREPGAASRQAAYPELQLGSGTSPSALRFCPSSSFFPPSNRWAGGWAARAATRLTPRPVRAPGSPNGSGALGPNSAAPPSSPLPGPWAPLLRSLLNPPLSVSLRVCNLYLFLFCIPK